MSANGRLRSLAAGGHGQRAGGRWARSVGGGWAGQAGTHRFPATSSTCNSAVWASSGGRAARRLSLRERTLSAAQPPISGGSASRRLRSALRLVSLVSFPSERGRAWPGKGRAGGRQKPAGLQKGTGAPQGGPLPHAAPTASRRAPPATRWHPSLAPLVLPGRPYRQQVLCENELGQVLAVTDSLGHLAQPVLVHLQDGQLLQLTWGQGHVVPRAEWGEGPGCPGSTQLGRGQRPSLPPTPSSCSRRPSSSRPPRAQASAPASPLLLTVPTRPPGDASAPQMRHPVTPTPSLGVPSPSRGPL